MIPLAHEEVVDVEHHLGQQPVVRSISRCVDQIASNVGPDSKGQEVAAPWTDIKECIAVCRIVRLSWQVGLISMVDIE